MNANRLPVLQGIVAALAVWLAWPNEGVAAINPGASAECEVVSHVQASNNEEAYGRDLGAAISHGDWVAARGYLLLGASSPEDLSKKDQRRLQRERLSVALIPASAKGDVRQVKRLLISGADPNILVETDNYMSPLAWAARCDHPRVVKLLIARGANVNARLGYSNGGGWIVGSTALIQAAESGAEYSVAILLAAGADVHLRETWVPSGGQIPPVQGRSALDVSDNARISAMLERAE